MGHQTEQLLPQLAYTYYAELTIMFCRFYTHCLNLSLSDAASVAVDLMLSRDLSMSSKQHKKVAEEIADDAWLPNAFYVVNSN